MVISLTLFSFSFAIIKFSPSLSFDNIFFGKSENVINDKTEQRNSLNIYNMSGNVAEKITNNSTPATQDNRESILLVGNSYSAFNDDLTIGLTDIKDKNAEINFNLDSRFSKVTVGQHTLFDIGNQRYKLLITEIDGNRSYIKFKIVPQ